MSIGSFLQTKENLELVKKNSWKFGRPKILEQGLGYYDDNPRDVSHIKENLQYMGLPASESDVDKVIKHIIYHYYEKLFVLQKTYEVFWIAKNRVEMDDSFEIFSKAKQMGKSVFIAQSHFGATYLMAAVLNCRGIEFSAVGNFPHPVGDMIKENNEILSKKFGAAKTNLVDLSKGARDVPMEMIRILMTGGIISNVFDENNQFCKEVTLLGKKLWGGTGMDLILKNFSDEKIILITPFLIRISDEAFRYEIDIHELKSGDIIGSFYKSLEKRIESHFEQWYFIHELQNSKKQIKK